MAINVQFNSTEENLIKEYGKANDMTVSDFIREIVIGKIEDEIDTELYDKSMAEHKEKDYSISFEEMFDDLDIEL